MYYKSSMSLRARSSFTVKIVPLPHGKEEPLLAEPKNEVPAEPQPSEKPKVKEEEPPSSGKKAEKKQKTPAKPKASSGGNKPWGISFGGILRPFFLGRFPLQTFLFTVYIDSI